MGTACERGMLAHAAFVAAFLLAGLPALIRGARPIPPREFILPGRAAEPAGARPFMAGRFVDGERLTHSVHAPAAEDIGGGDLMAVWYGGSEEGRDDVALYLAHWSRRAGGWSTPCLVADAAGTGADLGRRVRKIGNAVLHRDGRGRLWLFYVSVSAGGWSGSALNVKVSDNDGRDWGPARRLVTSPLLNMGTLVRCGAVRFRDGSFGLPVYHELFGKYGSLLVLDPGGRPIDERRISWGRSSLQPCVVPLDASRAIAFLRQSGMADRRVLLSRSFDGGKSWSPAEKLPLPNPDSAVSAVAADDETLLLACNTLEYDRDTLGLIRSRDVGRRWEMLHDFTAEGAEEAGLSYPFLIEAGDGIFHLLYSWNRERIGHVRFNRAWMGTPR